MEFNRSNIELAVGLNDIDFVKPSKFFKELTSNENDIDPLYIEKMLFDYYKHTNYFDSYKNDIKICDITSIRMYKLINDSELDISIGYFKHIHREIFKFLYPFAGEVRNTNIFKAEKILNGDGVAYTDFSFIVNNINCEFEKMKNIPKLENNNVIMPLSEFNSALWKVHPFKNGNTRATVVFMIKYLKSLGITMDNTPFIENSFYYRNALVRSNYYNELKNIVITYKYLIRFYENFLLSANHSLKSSDMICNELFDCDDFDSSNNFQYKKK